MHEFFGEALLAVVLGHMTLIAGLAALLLLAAAAFGRWEWQQSACSPRWVVYCSGVTRRCWFISVTALPTRSAESKRTL